MKTTILHDTTKISGKQVATIGFFDGVHQGHQFLINTIIDEARRRQMQSMLITFDRHPAEVVHPDYQPQLITTIDDKLALLSHTAIDSCIVLPFDKQMAALSPRDFMEQILLKQLSVKVLIIGYDNHFGHSEPGHQEGFDDYVAYGKQLGIEVLQAQPKTVMGIDVSSSVVRSLISEGEVEKAARCMGRPYRFNGIVVEGLQKGRQLGFPTANIFPPSVETMIPAPGVYAVMARVEGESLFRGGMLNIGRRPTFGGKTETLEVNVFDFSGDLYGKRLTVKFIRRMRDERQFNNEKELQEQLRRDEKEIRELLKE